MASPDPNIKQIRIVPSGPVVEAAAVTGGGAARKRGGGANGSRKARREGPEALNISKEGGGSTSPGTLVQLASSHVPGGAAEKGVTGVDSSLTQKGGPVLEGGRNKITRGSAPVAPRRGPAPAVAPTSSKGEAAKEEAKPTAPVKVVLEKAASKATAAAPKVILAPPSSQKGGKALATTPAHSKTRKASTSRKIKVSMKTLRKKIKKAKTIRKKAESTTLEEIKKDLHKAGIIKADSKAPEAILRQMYADFMTLKGKAL